MKFTPVLNKQIYKRMRDAVWHKYRKKKILVSSYEEELTKQGYTIVDANEFVQDVSPIQKINTELLPEVKKRFPIPPEYNNTHPDWQDKVCKIFNSLCFPIEGVKQAQIFTKSVLRKQLPLLDNIKDQLDPLIQHSFVEKAIKHSFLWDTQIDKLPKLMNLDIPSHKFPRRYGITAERSNEILIKEFVRICDGIDIKSRSKVTVNQQEFRVNLKREDFLVQFKLTPCTLILGKTPLKPITTDIQSTTNEKLPSIFPFSSVSNFEETNIYKNSDFTVFNRDIFPWVETTFFSHTIPGSFTHIYPRWNDDRFAGTTILYAFATALLNAKNLNLAESKDLPTPVIGQTVHFTGNFFQFALFQLNTLDLDNEGNKVKNIVWLSEKMPLYDQCTFELGIESFSGYNPDVFRNLSSLLCFRQ